MPRGMSEIPELRLSVLDRLITSFMKAPDLVLMNLFPSRNYKSDMIEWESMRGGRGMTPFVAPGSPAPRTAPHGVQPHMAKAAYWKEKMYFDEEFLNNLRQEGTREGYMDAKTTLTRNLFNLVNRSNRRKEWMFAQMLFQGSFSYLAKGGHHVSVDYDIPSENKVTLASAYMWGTGASADPLSDITTAKRQIKEECGGRINLALCNSVVLNYLAQNTVIRDILKKNAFGDGSLYKGNLHEIVGVNPQVIGGLLNIDTVMVYDEMYEIKSDLTAAVTGGSSTWISVEDAQDFVASEKIRFHDRSSGAYEDRYIISVDTVGGRVQVAYPPASSYKASEDYVTMKRYFLPSNKFVMMATRVDGEPIAEYMKAPFGLGRHYGTYTDKDEQWDPEGVYIRVQDKGLPVLFHRDAVYILDVQETTGEAATTTTTTSSSSTTTTTTA